MKNSQNTQVTNSETRFKGTQGMWEVYDDYIRSVDSGGIIADCYPTTDEDRANALLISKTPEMLEMLQDIVSNYYIDSDVVNNEIKQLIQEATDITK